MIRELLFTLKRRLFGAFYWVGPEVEMGVCDDCVSQGKPKRVVPLRRLMETDNLYLCRDHWDACRDLIDAKIQDEMKPFLRAATTRSACKGDE